MTSEETLHAATELRKVIIECGPYLRLSSAVAAEGTMRERNGLPERVPELDRPLWPDPLSIYWAVTPDLHPEIPPTLFEFAPQPKSRTHRVVWIDGTAYDLPRDQPHEPTTAPGGTRHHEEEADMAAGNDEARAVRDLDEFTYQQADTDRMAELDEEELRKRVGSYLLDQVVDEIERATEVARIHRRRAEGADALANRLRSILSRESTRGLPDTAPADPTLTSMGGGSRG